MVVGPGELGALAAGQRRFRWGGPQKTGKNWRASKRLQTIGNSAGLIIDKPILELLRITPETELDVSTDGVRLIITPIRPTPERRRDFKKAQARTLHPHERTFRKLAK